MFWASLALATAGVAVPAVEQATPRPGSVNAPRVSRVEPHNSDFWKSVASQVARPAANPGATAFSPALKIGMHSIGRSESHPVQTAHAVRTQGAYGIPADQGRPSFAIQDSFSRETGPADDRLSWRVVSFAAIVMPPLVHIHGTAVFALHAAFADASPATGTAPFVAADDSSDISPVQSYTRSPDPGMGLMSHRRIEVDCSSPVCVSSISGPALISLPVPSDAPSSFEGARGHGTTVRGGGRGLALPILRARFDRPAVA